MFLKSINILKYLFLVLKSKHPSDLLVLYISDFKMDGQIFFQTLLQTKSANTLQSNGSDDETSVVTVPVKREFPRNTGFLEKESVLAP